MKGVKRKGSLRPLIFGVLALALLLAAWESYRNWIGPWLGTEREVGKVLGFKLLPRANDLAMPSVFDMGREFGKPQVRGSSTSVFQAVAEGTFNSLKLAVAALVLGTIVGIGAAILMARFKVVQRGLMPYLVISQTIPLIALAPLTVTWGGEISFFGFEWQKWTSALVLGAFLSFFPIAVGALRGFNSPDPAALELMDSYASSWWSTWRKLRLPAAVPYLAPAMRLAGSAAVFGVVVSELSVGLTNGVGYLILSYMQEGTSRPAKVFTAVAGTIVLGLLMAAIINAVDRYLTRNRPQEELS
ncbi:MAG: ABC transporter permease subunit [Actinomycetia bacterium]|nr:ABC transporter permease subunit [Actinomycetes bacterium]